LYDLRSTFTWSAVLTVDFDVRRAVVVRRAGPPVDEARSIVFTRDGIILCLPDGQQARAPHRDKLLPPRGLFAIPR